MKIERSAELNKARIKKMQKTAELVDSLQFDAKVKLHENLQKDPKSYKKLLTDLLVQGLIKMIEPVVTLKVRKSDLALIKEVIAGAVAQYKAVMIKEVARLDGRSDIPCTVQIDEKNFLPEWNAADQKNSCLGGFMIFANRNRIVCSQTLDDRMALVFA